MTRGRRVDQWVPRALYGAPLRWTTPRLAGVSTRPHVALTFDDGPDPRSTPAILDTLAAFDVTATFFVIGEHAAANRNLLGEMRSAGHELAVHGWSHTAALRMAPRRLRDDLLATAELIGSTVGAGPLWYRPPYGIHTRAAHDAALNAGLTPVLWTAWGRDWSRWVGPAGIVWRVNRTAQPGGTVLLHDTDRYAAPDSWRRTNDALHRLLTDWLAAGWSVGPVREHWDPAAT